MRSRWSFILARIEEEGTACGSDAVNGRPWHTWPPRSLPAKRRFSTPVLTIVLSYDWRAHARCWPTSRGPQSPQAVNNDVQHPGSAID